LRDLAFQVAQKELGIGIIWFIWCFATIAGRRSIIGERTSAYPAEAAARLHVLRAFGSEEFAMPSANDVHEGGDPMPTCQSGTSATNGQNYANAIAPPRFSQTSPSAWSSRCVLRCRRSTRLQNKPSTGELRVGNNIVERDGWG
jgi:hypothetical protein